jgi:hypothetical protein
MTSPDTTQAPQNAFPVHQVWIGLALLVALAYLFGLGGAIFNGDELVYANIARLTATSGHWLPRGTSCTAPNHHCYLANTWWAAGVTTGRFSTCATAQHPPPGTSTLMVALLTLEDGSRRCAVD